MQITFSLAVTGTVDGQASQALPVDEVTITVATDFFSGYVTGPDFCAGLSLGGPATYPHDGDGDGVADVCSLPYTRREAVARQNALETLVGLNLTINVTDAGPDGEAGNADDRTSGATLTDLVLGREAVEASDGPDNTANTADDVAEVSAITGTCSRAKALDLLPDDPDACDDDATALSSPPDPIDPAEADLYYSGIISGPEFCTNFGLGGARLYAHDDDKDGVADVCSLPYTRREAVAQQMALEMFEGHPQFENAFKAACDALGSLTFGVEAADLARDACSIGLNPVSAGRGDPLP